MSIGQGLTEFLLKPCTTHGGNNPPLHPHRLTHRHSKRYWVKTWCSEGEQRGFSNIYSKSWKAERETDEGADRESLMSRSNVKVLGGAAPCLTTFFSFFFFFSVYTLFFYMQCLFLPGTTLFVGLMGFHHQHIDSILRFNTIIILIHLHFLEERTEGRKLLRQMERWGWHNIIMNYKHLHTIKIWAFVADVSQKRGQRCLSVRNWRKCRCSNSCISVLFLRVYIIKLGWIKLFFRK